MVTFIMLLLVGWVYSECNPLVPIHSIYRIYSHTVGVVYQCLITNSNLAYVYAM